MSENAKICKKCGESKLLSEFRARKDSEGNVRIIGTCKQCEREYAEKCRAENPDKVNKAARKSYAKHSAERRAQRRENYAEDPGKGKEYSREYRAKNSSKVKEADKERKDRNKEKISEYRKDYYAKNSEKEKFKNRKK